MSDYVIRHGEKFIAVDLFDDEPKRLDYEVWFGNDTTGDWEPLTYCKRYDDAVRAARQEARKRGWK
jgi:hypothetical protein